MESLGAAYSPRTTRVSSMPLPQSTYAMGGQRASAPPQSGGSQGMNTGQSTS